LREHTLDALLREQWFLRRFGRVELSGSVCLDDHHDDDDHDHDNVASLRRQRGGRILLVSRDDRR
jgi:hypothetical protein